MNKHTFFEIVSVSVVLFTCIQGENSRLHLCSKPELCFMYVLYN